MTPNAKCNKCGGTFVHCTDGFNSCLQCGKAI